MQEVENRHRPASIVAAIAAVAAAVTWTAIAGTDGARAEAYPDRPIRLIVPSAPGGPTDIPARLLSQILPKLGQPVVIENRPGAGGAIGARFVAAAAPDGYTLLVGNTSVLAVIPAVSAGAGYDPSRQFAPIAKFSESYQILVVHPSLAVKTVGEQSRQAQLRPDRCRRAAASHRRIVQVGGRRRHRRRALQERRGFHHRRARRPGPHDLRGNHGAAAPDPGRPAAGARRDQPHPHAARRRSAHHDRGRRFGLRGHDLQWRGGAGRHPGADYPAPLFGHQRRPARTRDAGQHPQSRRGLESGFRCGIQRLYRGRGAQMVRCRQGGERAY